MRYEKIFYVLHRFPDEESKKSTRRRQLDAELDGLNDKDYIVMEATAKLFS